MKKGVIVAIDGPAGAGKTTVTRRVAETLGYLLVDTGALYRTVALAAVRQGLDFDDRDRVGALAGDLARRGAIELESAGSACLVLLEGEDVSGEIRTPQISQGASKVSAIPLVRDALLEMQRAAGKKGGVVLEGRDIGTVVFPNAQAKFFLTASTRIRAERRHRELVERGGKQSLSEVEEEVLERDRRDSSRPVAPLLQAADAEAIDSSVLSVDAVVELIVSRVRAIEARSSDAAG